MNDSQVNTDLETLERRALWIKLLCSAGNLRRLGYINIFFCLWLFLLSILVSLSIYRTPFPSVTAFQRRIYPLLPLVQVRLF
jgi:hypothetical protein